MNPDGSSLHQKTNGNTVADELRNALHRLVLATLFLLGLILVMGVLGFVFLHQFAVENSQRIDDIAASRVEAHTRLCAAEGVLIKSTRVQVARSVAFLKTHPTGIPGVPVHLLRASIRTQRDQIRQLTDPSCTRTPPAPKGGGNG